MSSGAWSDALGTGAPLQVAAPPCSKRYNTLWLFVVRRTGTKRRPVERSRQLNVRIEEGLYRAVEAVARDERRSVPQTARLLLEDGLRQRGGVSSRGDSLPASSIARLADAGGAFSWLEDEPDLYDERSGEPA